MNDLKIFESEAFGKSACWRRTANRGFMAADVCRALELDRTQSRRLDDDEKGVCSIPTPGGPQETSVVNEPGLYALVLGSRKPEAKAFKRWITHEVIPSIHRHGAYMTPETLEAAIMNPDYLLKVVVALKDEKTSARPWRPPMPH